MGKSVAARMIARVTGIRTIGTWTARKTATPRNASPIRNRQLHCARRSSHTGTIEVDSPRAPVTSMSMTSMREPATAYPKATAGTARNRPTKPAIAAPIGRAMSTAGRGIRTAPRKTFGATTEVWSDVDQDDRDEDGAGGGEAA